MLKNILLISFCISLCHTGSAQKMVGHRYKDLIFADVTVSNDLSYAGDGISDKNKTYQYDLYQPVGDQATRRPLVIWMHGGGFKFGSKSDKDIQLWCRSFAQRGYVCAAINYSLHKANFSFKYDVLKKDCYKAVDDLKKAIAYFKANASRYHLDTTKIILAGNSAGGMMALQAAYCNPADLKKMGQVNDPAIQIEGRVKAAAVINFWGALFDIHFLNNARVPIVSVHGSNDGNVPLTEKTDARGGIYGSMAIHHRADELHIPNTIKVYEGYAHQLQKHFNPFFANKDTQERWAEAGQFAADFLYNKVFTGSKP